MVGPANLRPAEPQQHHRAPRGSIAPMSVILTPIDVSPKRGTFSLDGLDTLRRGYKSGSNWKDVLAAAPAKFVADDDYDNMFLLDVVLRESGKEACLFDYLYTGLFDGDTLPPGKESDDQTVGSASFSGVTLTYNAPVSVYEWISRVKGVGGLAVPPASNATSGAAALTGSAFAWDGSTGISASGSAFTTEVVVGDIVIVYKDYPSVPQLYVM